MKLFALLYLSSLVAAPIKPADKVVAELQKSWDSFKTFRCQFTQEVSSKTFEGIPDVSEGTLALSKPDRLRWESTTEGTTSILNEKELVVVRKSLRRTANTVDIYPKGKTSLIPKSLTFLTGNGRFATLYRHELLEDSKEIAKVKLTPRDRPEESYIAEIVKDGYVLRALTTETVDTRVVTTFTKIEKNPTLDPELFTYKAQPTDVIHRN